MQRAAVVVQSARAGDVTWHAVRSERRTVEPLEPGVQDHDHKQALPGGYRLKGYRVEAVLGVGGFGVTYLAEDVTLQRRVAIKEYLPNELAVRDGATVQPRSTRDRSDFEWGLARFLDEARTLAQSGGTAIQVAYLLGMSCAGAVTM